MTEVAKAIFEQLGGRKFMVMTGARSILFAKDGLMFKLPSNFAKNGINHVKVTLNQFDTYDMEFHKLTGGVKFKDTIMVVMQGVYADQLQRIFTGITGLDTGGLK